MLVGYLLIDEHFDGWPGGKCLISSHLVVHCILSNPEGVKSALPQVVRWATPVWQCLVCGRPLPGTDCQHDRKRDDISEDVVPGDCNPIIGGLLRRFS